MKNFMPNLLKNLSSPLPCYVAAPTRVVATPIGKVASFIFVGLTSWFEQGRLIMEKDS
jgi:hypothetical protein